MPTKTSYSLHLTHSAFHPFIKAVGRGEKLKRDLTYEEASEALRLMLRREATDAQIGAFLIAQRVKGEAVPEINGFVDVVRNEFMHGIHPKVTNLLDLAVPWDGKVKTAQLAPAIGLTLAKAGVPVLMHGAEDIPTKSGITQAAVLEQLGIPVMAAPAVVAQQIEATGFGYLAAPQYAPDWHSLLDIRHQFGLRTVMNTVEKLFNPGNAPFQISGFFHGNYIDRLRTCQTGTTQNWIIQGEEGSIEMVPSRRTHIFAEAAANDIILDPSAVDFTHNERIHTEPTLAAHVTHNKQALRNTPSPARDQVTYTVGVILSLLGAATSIENGIRRAHDTLARGVL